jgi:sugar lactone lactonase YvrE
MTEPVSIWPLQATLGEGPVWSVRDQALWFVDVDGRRIHRYDPASRATRSWDAPDIPSFVFPAADGRFIVGMRNGLNGFDPETGRFTLLLSPEPDRPTNRLNDASVGPDGTLWFGSMNLDHATASGAFYRLDGSGRSVRLVDGCGITNGPAVSPDGRIFYHTDTMQCTIDAADVADDGSLSNRRVFATFDYAQGAPDGTIVDSEGCLWVGLWGGWCVRRFAPDGTMVDEVRFPVANITKLALGGPGLKTAYVTTARLGLDEAALANQPQAGDLFSFEVDVPGLAPAELSVGLNHL